VKEKLLPRRSTGVSSRTCKAVRASSHVPIVVPGIQRFWIPAFAGITVSQLAQPCSRQVITRGSCYMT